ncbi:MAG TPA: hypothetical protein VKH37_04275, partial [Ferruginibacter sp.]|nr:hypothetical protein [Ferruginibacter sp.]
MSALPQPIGNLMKFIGNFLRIVTRLLRIIYLLFPAFLFFIAAWIAFWKLSQGRDVLIAMLERKGAGGIVLLAILFWSMVNWYSSRMLVYRRDIEKDSPIMGQHIPRLLGYFGFTIVWLGILRLPVLNDPAFNAHVKTLGVWLLLGLSFGAYCLLTILFEKYKKAKLMLPVSDSDSDATIKQKQDTENRRYRILYTCIGIGVALLIALNMLINSPSRAWLFFGSVILIQLCFLFFVVVRLGSGNMQMATAGTKQTNTGTFNSLGEKLFNNPDIWRQERSIFIVYQVVAVLSIAVYVYEIVNYEWSVKLGALPTVLIAFGVLVGLFSIISFFSIVTRINFHMIILILILLFGKFFNEPHYVATIDAKTTAPYDQRPSLKDYFFKWAERRKDDIIAARNAGNKYPVYFELADGGASRSGYWTAITLGTLEDVTNGDFSKHLFCLSGASGGSVGNGTFLALLKAKNEVSAQKTNYTDQAARYLKSDFLSYTLARMLGPDFVRPMFGGLPIADRATALENALEKGEDDSAILYGKFKTAFSEYIPSDNNELPIICVNVTRVQDGCPSVVSTMKLDESFGQRVDILATMPKDK